MNKQQNQYCNKKDTKFQTNGVVINTKLIKKKIIMDKLRL